MNDRHCFQQQLTPAIHVLCCVILPIIPCIILTLSLPYISIISPFLSQIWKLCIEYLNQKNTYFNLLQCSLNNITPTWWTYRSLTNKYGCKACIKHVRLFSLSFTTQWLLHLPLASPHMRHFFYSTHSVCFLMIFQNMQISIYTLCTFT